MPAPWRDRVQHHARRFQEKDATTVLNRYEQQRRIMSRPQLEKHAFHVACWLVLPEVRRSHGGSVEALLSRYLESLDGQPLCERLKAVLSLVSASSGVAGLSGLLGKGRKRKVEMMQAEEPEKPDSSKPVDACGEKALRLMQKASQTWQNHPSECREAYVESLEQEMQEADGAENSAKLRMVLRQAVAALSPPRRLGDGCEGKLLASHASNDQATLATNLQSRLRKIVLRCLDRVDLADLRLAPVLQCLQSLLHAFQELVTSESTIACKKQWARLQAKCASTMPPEAGSSGVAGLSGLLGKGRKRKAEMIQVEEPEKPDSSKPVDACGEKAVRLMQKASQTWQNHLSECREEYVESLEQEMQEADGAENSAKLRTVLRRAVAALSPPRRLGDGCEGKTPSIACNDQSLATNLQTRLRKIVLRCLDRVDLADVRLAPVLQCLQSLLRTFQELVTGENKIACKKQWARLQDRCASTMPPEAAASLSACAKGAEDGAGIAKPEFSASCHHGKLRRSCAQCRGCPHGKRPEHCQQCSACPHGKVKRNCSECKPCPHGKAKRICSQCTGCPHGKKKQYCLQCSACPHGKIKRNCVLCSACPHGKIKQNCLQCSACPHGKIKKNCVQCSACPHGKLKTNCRMCAEARGKVNCTLSG